MTTALELDRFRLPMPSPTTPVIPPHLAIANHGHTNACYREMEWPLSLMIKNPSASLLTIYWRDCDEDLREELRLAAWTMINGELRPTFLKERSVRLRSRLSPDGTQSAVNHWKLLAKWLAKRGIRSLSACDSGVLHEYGLHLRNSGGGRPNVRRTLVYLTRLWAFDQLSARPTGIGRPPWDEFGADDYLPEETSTAGENEREPLAEQTMGPLLVRAIRMVEDLSDDILAAWAESQRLSDAAKGNRPTAAGQAALDAYLGPLIAAGAPLPSNQFHGAPALARNYIAGRTGASRRQVDSLNQRHGLSEAAAQRPGPCPLDLPVTGLVAGKPWRQVLDFNETAVWMRHLATASFIVCSYLTGMRPEEVLGMRSGCCPDPEPDEEGNLSRHLIRSYEYKTATDDDGNHLSGGVERDVPWVAIAPVVNSIRVLERIVPEGYLLFDHLVHDLRFARRGSGALKPGTLRERIEEFVAWSNAEAIAQGLPEEVIERDPHGPIGTARFRRSLAWHIARRPGGLVALAIQYGHMRTALLSEIPEATGGYGARSRGGIHELVDMETVLAVAETAAELSDHFASGGGVSGPAAKRALQEAATAPRFEGRLIKADFARKFLARDGAVLYDNPHALLICLYRQDRALCARGDLQNAPTLDHCVPGCGNTVRTDEHAAQLRVRADIIEKRAAHTPKEVGDRLRANAGRLRAYADDHDRTRITQLEAAG